MENLVEFFNTKDYRYFLDVDIYDLTAFMDYWLWDVIISGQVAKSFPLFLNGISSNGNARLSILLKGATATPHHVKVILNGSEIGESSWQGTDSHQFTISFNQSILQENQNTIRIEGILSGNTPYSIFYIDSFDLKTGESGKIAGKSLVKTKVFLYLGFWFPPTLSFPGQR